MFNLDNKFEIQRKDIKDNYYHFKSATTDQLIKECNEQIMINGTLNDIGKFCFDIYCSLSELKRYEEQYQKIK